MTSNASENRSTNVADFQQALIEKIEAQNQLFQQAEDCFADYGDEKNDTLSPSGGILWRISDETKFNDILLKKLKAWIDKIFHQ